MPHLDIKEDGTVEIPTHDRKLDEPGLGVAAFAFGTDGSLRTRVRGGKESVIGDMATYREFVVGPNGAYQTVKEGIEDNQDLIEDSNPCIIFTIDGDVEDPDPIVLDYANSSYRSSLTIIKIEPQSIWKISGGLSLNQNTYIYCPINIIEPLGGGVENQTGRLEVYSDIAFDSQCYLNISNLAIISENKAVHTMTVNGECVMNNCTLEYNNNTFLVEWNTGAIFYITNCDMHDSYVFDFTDLNPNYIFLRNNTRLSINCSTPLVLNPTKCIGNNFISLVNTSILTGSMNSMNGMMV